MTEHKHSLGGKYTSTVNVPIPSITGLAKQADIDALAARVAALEGAVPPPVVTPPPVIVPGPGSVSVSTIPDLLAARRNLAYSEIILKAGIYQSSWLDLQVVRTQVAPVLIRAESPGSVTLDFGGTSTALLFRNGCAYETWLDLLKIANCHPADSGVVMFGEGDGTPVHDLKLQNVEFLPSVSAAPGPNGNYQNGQGLYFSKAGSGGNHDITVDGFKSVAALWSQVHVYHDELDGPGHNNVVRNFAWTLARQPHAQMGIVAYSAKMKDYLFENGTISGANEYAVYHHYAGTATLRNVVSTGSGVRGLQDDAPGLTLVGSVLA